MAKLTRKERLMQEHQTFLAKHGIGKRKRLTGAVTSPMTVSYDPKGKVALGSIPSNGIKGRGNTPAGDRIIGQAYNKGPLMVLGSKDELKNASRRDRG
jgi:hypothetical protein